MITYLKKVKLNKDKKFLEIIGRENFGTVKIPESLRSFYEKKKEEIELKKKKLEEKKKKMDKVTISKERKNKFKSSKGQHNIY
ncbi:conserved Plasmodium protein, unknown function [Plasmodium gallinaceum]|uniref:Uncharacterized protein n=1 Tax=Plasmodium gallinaceum TaxID=5849 RepID=A0A1J1GVU6_PLAGA|nr:conserved Plasmodium protein, unknown function [Plasmodium gallinaceum]CRG96674.1 conserved Plasmodium protein, unknown function [Plasmodium gallinaceum]